MTNSPFKSEPPQKLDDEDRTPACHSDDADERLRLQILFDSTLPAAHAEAKKLCDVCTVVASCRKRLEDTKRDYGYGPSVGPQGTWAGQLVGDLKQNRLPCDQAGTAAGHNAHRQKNHAPCDECAEWSRMYKREWKKKAS